ncbi:MAG: ATP-binding cassette domain-containing protein [Ignavibacterium album]|uniref:ABC transporter ATP-binding protein n=1 Tax=Ignavibacterium album TaxID=591197 RepID=UPI0026F10FEA|nr:ATP-binding cassette domain-containing protein [Ignavibacterium album]MCX8106109.1 ATP-binding cassette domain-containing protein [Ignavibacterium album]
MLEVKNLVKTYGRIKAVDNLSFTVKPGKIFGLLGPNGAGKTTTIRTILNIIKPNSGEVLLNQKPVTQELFNSIGYLPEERGLYKKSKVIDVISYLAKLKGMNSNSIKSESDKWLKKLEIPQYRERKVEELSKGNQQKIQFITAVIHNPEMLILDEPFSGFDPINQQLIKDVILDLLDNGKIIILSTHQMDTAEKLCNEILLINEGKEVLSGSLSEIKQKFGGNHVKFAFDGEVKFLDEMNEVLSFELYSNEAEVHLRDEVKPEAFLRKIIDRVTIKQFSVIEPTLNKIFIDSIKNKN